MLTTIIGTRGKIFNFVTTLQRLNQASTVKSVLRPLMEKITHLPGQNVVLADLVVVVIVIFVE